MANGTRLAKKGLVRRYRCTPAQGDAHSFTVVVAPPDRPRRASWEPPPPCPDHPGSKVVRNGTYGKKTAKPRQRYRCTPADGSPVHAFTPPLPRDHVHENKEHCEHCEELRGVHRGETAVARRHAWSTRVVAAGLEKLASGQSYAEVGRWALRSTNTKRTRTPAPAPVVPAPTPAASGKKRRKSSPASKTARNVWHIGADWVEAFAPAVYAPVDAQLRTTALAERARLDEARTHGQALERPQVILVDDVPVYGRELDSLRTKAKSRRDAGFFILVVAETHWDPTGPSARLRLARAMAKSNTPAWRLVFAELGYEPDFVVADAGTGIGAAVAAHFDPARTAFVPSLWHLANRVERALADTHSAFAVTSRGRELIAPLAAHLRRLGRHCGVLDDTASWSTWWDELEMLLRAHRLPLDKVRTQRRNSESRMGSVLGLLKQHPEVPVSTGGVESLIASNIAPLLARRRSAFANIERTNLLLDLVIAHHHGAFDHLDKVAAQLRADTAESAGWTVPLRAIADPRPHHGSYSSLRDATLLADLAESRGLT